MVKTEKSARGLGDVLRADSNLDVGQISIRTVTFAALCRIMRMPDPYRSAFIIESIIICHVRLRSTGDLASTLFSSPLSARPYGW